MQPAMGRCYRTWTRTERSGSCCWTLLDPPTPTKALHGAEPLHSLLLAQMRRSCSPLSPGQPATWPRPPQIPRAWSSVSAWAGSARRTAPRACAGQQPGPLEEAAPLPPPPVSPPGAALPASPPCLPPAASGRAAPACSALPQTRVGAREALLVLFRSHEDRALGQLFSRLHPASPGPSLPRPVQYHLLPSRRRAWRRRAGWKPEQVRMEQERVEPLAFEALARGGCGSKGQGLVGLHCHWEGVRVTTRGLGGPFTLVPVASLLAPSLTWCSQAPHEGL